MLGRSPELARSLRTELEAVGRSMVDHALALSDVIDVEEQRVQQQRDGDLSQLDAVVGRHISIMRELMTRLQSLFGQLG